NYRSDLQGTREHPRLWLGRLGVAHRLSRRNLNVSILGETKHDKRSAQHCSKQFAMQGMLTRARLILHVAAIACLIMAAPPAFAQQQPGAKVDPDASVQSEQMLLRQAPRIEGLIDQPDQRERVLIQPAGRLWDHFHEVTLRWVGTIVIFATLAALA